MLTIKDYVHAYRTGKKSITSSLGTRMLNGLKEITGGEFPPHTYFLSKGNEGIYAYHNCITDQFVMFTKSLSFSKSGRKFEKVKYS
jgi:hypothetical protein